MDVFKSTSAERQKDGIHVVCTTTLSSSAASRPIDHSSVASRESVRDLSVYLDSDMSMHKHVTQLVCLCYGVLRQLRSIRRSLPRTALTTLVSSFIMSNLAGLPQRELDRVQSVVNAAARLSADALRYDHVTPLLMDLHWIYECLSV